jgi:hypothetical protein
MNATDDADKTAELTADKFAWGDLSRHPNKKACKPWAQKITGTHPKYTVDGEWLDKTTIDGEPHFSTDDLAAGDIIKVSGASHSNKKNAYYRVLSVNGEIAVNRMSEADVLEALESDEDESDLADTRREIIEQVEQVDDADDLDRIADYIDRLNADDE